ncbi:MAG: hypothetical protein HYV75_11745, partial [Opitutae bacterium]|nr:hypothetical protein [Opitutae bacterium]
SGWSAADSERLAALIRLEGAIHLKGLPGYDADYPAEDFFVPLFGPSMTGVAAGQDVMAELMQIFEWTYFRGGAGRDQWPAVWLSRGKSLRDNQPIVRGWDALDRSMQSAQDALRDAIQAIQGGRLTVVRFNNAEKAFLQAVAQPATDPAWAENVLSAWGDLANRRTALDKLVTDLKGKTGVTGDVTLDASYRATVARMRAETGQASQLIRAALLKQKAAAEAAAGASAGPASEFTLYKDMERRLTALDAQVTAQLGQLMSASEEAQLADLDISTLVTEEGTAVYTLRSAAYADIIQVMAPTEERGPLLGRLADALGQQAATLAAVRERMSKYTGAQRHEFTTGVRTLLEAAATRGVEGTVNGYQRELGKIFPDTLGYPLGSGPALTPEQLRAVMAEFAKVRADAAATGLPAEARRTLGGRFDKVEKMAAFAARLAGADGNPAAVRLVLPSDQEQEGIVQRALGSAGSKQAITRVYKSVRVADRIYPLSGLPESVMLEKFNLATPLPRLEFFTTVGPKTVPDATVEPGPAWGALRLLQQGAVRRADGKEWDAIIRLNNRGTDLVLAVTIVLDQGLPASDQWPAATR